MSDAGGPASRAPHHAASCPLPGFSAAQNATMDKAGETILDLRGLLCPQPVLRAKKALRSIPVGDAIVLECTDPLTVIDVPNFVRQTRHVLSEQSRRGAIYIFKIVKQH